MLICKLKGLYWQSLTTQYVRMYVYCVISQINYVRLCTYYTQEITSEYSLGVSDFISQNITY